MAGPRNKGSRRKLKNRDGWIRITDPNASEEDIMRILTSDDPVAEAARLGVAAEEIGPSARPDRLKEGPPPSSKGKEVVVADQSSWRRKLQESKIKFDDAQKEIFLDQIAEHSMRGRACDAAGISGETFRQHLKNDKEFAEAFDAAVQRYRDKVVDHAQTLLFEGELETKYDKDGNLLSERVHYPIQLIAMEMKRVDPSYRENAGGAGVGDNPANFGVLVVPMAVSPEDWIARQQAANLKKLPPSTMIDAEYEEVQDR